MREGVGVLYDAQCSPEDAVQPRGWGDGAVVSARYRKDEQALVHVDATQRGRPRAHWGQPPRSFDSGRAAVVPSEDLRAEADGVCRSLRNQAATSEGAKR